MMPIAGRNRKEAILTYQTIKANVRLEPSSTEADIDRTINQIIQKAREAIGTEPNRALVIVDRTGYRTVIRAQVGREE